MSSPTFSDLPLSPDLQKNLSTLGYRCPTPIQSAALPAILDGRDVLGQAKTGSGKTAAFSLGFLQHLDVSNLQTQVLVLCPVRELAEQVAAEIRRLARCIPNIKLLCLCGGMPWRSQEISMRAGAHIVVGTPGRIGKHLRKDLLQLSSLRCLVLDEADRLLDMGFHDEVMNIVRQSTKKRQTLLFSATFPDDILTLSRNTQKNPERISVDTEHREGTVIHQDVFAPTQRDKCEALVRILHREQVERALIFCATREGCREVTRYLSRSGFSVKALHGDMEQRYRSDALIRFSNRSLSILVATDVAARGLDITDLPLVINFDPAQNADLHTHRMGRTGRAGRSGKAYTLRDRPRKEAVAWHSLDTATGKPPPPPMICYHLNGGKKDKIRPGDILGALIKEAGLPNDSVGNIHVGDTFSIVAIRRDRGPTLKKWATKGRIKGKRLSAWDG